MFYDLSSVLCYMQILSEEFVVHIFHLVELNIPYHVTYTGLTGR